MDFNHIGTIDYHTTAIMATHFNNPVWTMETAQGFWTYILTVDPHGRIRKERGMEETRFKIAHALWFLRGSSGPEPSNEMAAWERKRR